jgi:archaellum biogenesis ATPase FlaH
MTIRLEDTILKNLIYFEEYTRKAIPYIKSDYFSDNIDKILFDNIKNFLSKYNSLPSKESLLIELGEDSKLTEEQFQSVSKKISQYYFEKDDKPELEWVVDTTEKFCQDRAIYNAVLESIQILDGENKNNKDKGTIPTLLSEALSVCFDPYVGHDYIEDAEERYKSYHEVEERIPFDLDFFNKITKGGLPRKTLNIALAGTGVGKSLFMCHHAAACLSNGMNVLYITLEMAEERIAQRIDANLMNITMDELEQIPKDAFDKKMSRIRNMVKGKLIVKEYPTASANVNHFRNLMNELKLKRRFSPDIIFVDYINIATSSRLKFGNSVNSYNYIKSIAEELRGLAVECDVPIISATQTTRSGYTNSDIGLEDTSESFGLPATADFMFALISTEELEDLNQMLVKQLKNRYNDLSMHKRFVIGVDRAKMKLYDLEDSAQVDLIERTNQKKGMKMPWGKKKDEDDDIPSFDIGTDNRMSRKKDFSEFSFR